ncbi:TonB-dependent hemoglobin/transferrin/lactoferrin family receptor [Microvirga arabica]|uniref:TonB-dependent hemoglobin/transferrin/lactoferrin family receptor n=1 Tax=Microvirga arabica TaxID=1128671 RepID=UPI00193A2E12|nr:TonB-dependent hemoglobin/transferrin/lactoferrin family receptor [Microvirga arabica]MBM1170515.1 TonB-dependent hemoglobin/transferrin/lactoferrin family receptor [Microvirga arabica]
MITFLREGLRASTSPLALLVLAPLAGTTLITGAQAQAQGQAPTPEAPLFTTLDAITVTAERAPTSVYDSPATVSVTAQQEIDQRNINSPRDLAREEPGVSVGNQPPRGGATNYVIRGIGENRVRVQVDGVKIPDFPETNIGAGTYTRDFVDFDSLKQVEIIRGPSSALYGSDAIGGVVSYVTKDPSDYLNLVGKDWYLSAKTGYDTEDRSFLQTYTGAWRFGPWESLILYTHRQGHEVRPNLDDDSTLRPNPQDFSADNVLAKLLYNAGDWGQFKLTGEFLRKEVGTELLSDRSNTPGGGGMPFSRVFDSDADDTTTRPRLSFDWTLPVTWSVADTVRTSVYWTKVDREEKTLQQRGTSFTGPPAEPNRIRFSDFGFNQEIYGAEVQFSGTRQWGEWEHSFIYGASVDSTTTSRPRNRIERNLDTGVETPTISGENFPNKNFPDTETVQAGLYVQDTARYGRLRIIPAIRFDTYHLDPNPDADFDRSNQRDFGVEEQNELAVSPKFGITYDLTDQLRVFSQYARGFRAPPYDTANFGFSNPVFFYEILPNGNLKPETSDGFEVGLRGRFDNGSSFQVSGFYNLYNDFIETVTVGTSPAGLTQFQYQNLSNVRIWGVEAKGDWRLTPNWSIFGALAYAQGEDEETGLPIDSVDPFTAHAGIRYQHEAGWGAEVRARGAAGKNRVSDATYFRPDSYVTMDALVFYDPTPNLSLNLSAYNLLDAEYHNAQDVAGVLATNRNLDLLRASGRTFALNATIRW